MPYVVVPFDYDDGPAVHIFEIHMQQRPCDLTGFALRAASNLAAI
jgi:hypothetical protein